MSENAVKFVPKNIRQIGVALPNDKIYIEDYVMTYIKQLSGVLTEDKRILLLVGNRDTEDGVNYCYISGVVELRDKHEGYTYQDLLLNDNITKLTRIKEDYYGDMDFMGMCVICKNELIKFDEGMYMYFQNGMMGDVLIVRDEINEEKVYRYSFTNFIKQRGYYIFYDRNESMQNYMLCMKDGKSIEYGYSPSEIIDRRVDEKIRAFSIPKNDVYTTKGVVVEGKKNVFKDKWKYKWKYAMASCFVLAVLGMGVIKVNKLAETTTNKAELMENKVEQEDNNTLQVETVAGELVINEEDVQSVNGDNTQDADSNGEYGNEAENNSQEVVHDNYKENDVNQDDARMNNDGKSNINNKGEDGNEIDNGPSYSEENNKSDSGKIEDNVANDTKGDISKKQASNKNKKVASNKENANYYIVRKGDALVDISRKMYGTHKKVATIKQANGLEDEDKIFIGQKLLIP